MARPLPTPTEEPREASATRWLTIRVPIVEPPEGSNIEARHFDGRLSKETGRTLVKIMHALYAEHLELRDGGLIDLARPGARINTVRWLLEQVLIAMEELPQ